MRIGLIHIQYGDGGGLEKYLAGFAQHLLGAPHEVHLITNRVHHESSLDARFQIHHTKVSSLSRTKTLTAFNQAAAAKAKALNLDLTIGFGQTTTQDIHRAGGGCHKLYSNLLPPWKRLAPKNKTELALEESLYTDGNTRHFVVNSALVLDQLQETYQLPLEKLTVIHTPVDSDHFRPPENPDPAILTSNRLALFPGHDRNLPVFLFASLDHNRKGLDTLLNAWPGIEAELWIAGAPLDSSHQRAIHKNGLTQRVHALGHQAEMTPLYQAADFLVHPTRYDACSNVVLQAMACALPPLVSNNDGASTFVDPGANGFILDHPTNPDSLRDMIFAALDLDPAQRQSLGQKAREKVLPLTWDHHLAQWQALFSKLANSSL
ncbi:MAG: glycosyltransferase family 4 protein [Verrucomicrobiota bacterium]